MMLTTQQFEQLTELNDSALVKLSLAKDATSFNVLMKRYLKPVYSFIYHTVHNTEMAEDLTQETFLRVYRALGQFDQQRLFKPWVFTIATNVCKTALKKNQNTAILLSEQADGMNLLENRESLASSEVPVRDSKVAVSVQQALQKLPAPVRQALILRHVYDLSYEQVAHVMHANTNTVRTWLRRGRDSMKSLLGHTGGLYDQG